MARPIPPAALLLALLAACAPGSGPPEQVAGLGPADPPSEWIVVDFVDGTTKAEFDAWEQAWGIDLEYNSVMGPETGITLAHVDGDPEQVLARIRTHPAVEAAEPLERYEALWEPNDPDYKLQWHLAKVGAAEAWDQSRGRGVVVAVIDTGIAYTRYGKSFRVVEDLEGARFVPGWDFVHERPEAVDDHGHGTHVAGTIAQVTNNGKGVAGLAPEAALMPLKVLSAQGYGNSADIADAIRWAADHGASVINMSLGGGGYSHVMANAVKYARKKGVVIVAAAGNSGRRGVSYPAAYDGVIAVSATRYDDALAPYSSYGPQVDIAAPGGDKSVDQNGDGYPDGVLQNTIAIGRPGTDVYEWFQGTSMATPHVAAAAALVMATGITDPDAVEEVLTSSARKVAGQNGPNEKYGHGVLDAAAALRAGQGRRGLGRFLWAAVVFLLLLLRRGWPAAGAASSVLLRPSFVVGAVLAGVGLFFLPWVLPPFAGEAVLSSALLDWGLYAFGPRWHANPLTYSAALPLLAGLLLFHKRSLRPLLSGLAAGTAAFLLHALFARQVDVVLLPGRLLDLVWLAANAALAFFLAWSMSRPEASRSEVS